MTRQINLKTFIIFTTLLPFFSCSYVNPENDSFAPEFQFDHFNHIINFSIAGVSTECKRSVEKLQSLARNFDLAALKILDASAKLGSGLLNGNINQYGDFDECLQASGSGELKGKFCLVDIQFHLHQSLDNYRNLLMSFEQYRNKFNEIVHITPKHSNLLWAVCMPSTCTHRDLEVAVKSAIDENFGKYIKSMELAVNERNCQSTAEDETNSSKFNFATKLTIGLFAIILLASLISTFYDLANSENDEDRHELLLAFSMRKNFNEIISTEINNKEISTLHGIRFVITILVMMCHKCMATHYLPIANRTQIKGLYEGIISVPFRAGYLSTEVFLMVSGLLTTYSLVGKFNRGQSVGIFREILARYLRYIPAVAGLVLFYTYVLPILDSGPFWRIIIESQSDMCKAYGWRNFLMIHNWFAFEDICMFNLHHIGTDFTLFAISIVLIIGLRKKPNFTLGVFLLIAIVSTIARFHVVYVRDLAVYVRYGVSIEKLIETGNVMYGIPPYRFTCYAVGVCMGLALRNHAAVTFKPRTLKLGWFLSACGLICTAFISILNNSYGDPLLMAFFAAVAPLTFCAFFAWIIYVAQCGFKNAVINFFAWKYFKVTTSLSYGVYLVQFVIFNYTAGVARTPITFSIFHHMFDLNEFLFIFAAALVMTLFIELPFENVRKRFFDTKRASRRNKPSSDNNANRAN